MVFGAIADDYTGASDLAGMLAQEGVRTVQLLGLPSEPRMEELAGRFDAAVISLKSRSIPKTEACEMSLQALARLQLSQPRQIQFKYCSTFDSTPEGNIGPVTAALMDKLGVSFTIAAPALPVNQRTQYCGYLFVGGELLSDSPMRRHPLNPMTEPSLVRHLQAQTDKKVGLIAWPAVRSGADAVREEIERAKARGVQIALADALEDRDLEVIAEAIADFPLITGGSGIASKLPALWKRRKLLSVQKPASPKLGAGGKGVLILSGSCSQATLRQLERFRASGGSAFELKVTDLLAGQDGIIERLCQQATRAIEENSVAAIYSSAAPEVREDLLRQAQEQGLPAEEAPLQIEKAFAELARRMVHTRDIRKLITAGGETSGAALAALGVTAVEVLDILDPGVPCLRSLDEPEMALALKSGNFGGLDFFLKATRYMEAL